MRSSSTRALGRTILALAAVVLAGCGPDLPTATTRLQPINTARTVVAAALESELDPSIPPSCHGYVATIWWNMPAELIPTGVTIRPVVPGDHATPGAEELEEESPGYVITGTTGNDVIVGSPQRDSIVGGSGDDVICGDPPQHEGEPGSEVVPDAEDGCSGGGMGGGHGGGGPDHLWGGNGDDRIYGGGGPDTIYAGNGADVVVGGGGPDAILGENGDDILYGGPGPDWLHGGLGNDLLSGDVAGDHLFGDAGDDTLLGGGGFDVADGGAGANVVDLGPQDAGDDDGGCEGGHGE